MSIEDFFNHGNDIKPIDMDPVLQALLENWRATINHGGTGFLPRRWQGRSYWYAFASSARQRRELLGLLDAWIGPTYSDLSQLCGELDLSDDFDVSLTTLEVFPLKFEVLPRSGTKAGSAKLAVRNALITLTFLVNKRPPSQFDAARTTVEILDDLGHAVAANDRNLASTCMAELERSADLDESNLAFLRIRIHAGLRDWAALFEDPALSQVLSMRRPLGVTRAIQSAIYHDRFEQLDHHGSAVVLRAAAEQLQQPLRLTTTSPPSTRAEATVELICRLLVAPTAADRAVNDVIETAAQIEQGLEEHFSRIVEAFFPQTPDESGVAALHKHVELELDPEVRISDLMIEGEYLPCIELGLASEPSIRIGQMLVFAARRLSSAKWANEVINYLNDNQLKEAVAAKTPMFSEDVLWLESTRNLSEVEGWDDWFRALDSAQGDPSHDSSQFWAPLPLNVFVELLTQASDDSLARLGENGGEFLAAHHWLLGRPETVEVTLRLIAALALSNKASAGIRVQTLALVESLASSDPSRSTFEEAMEWTTEILIKNTAATTVTWACDILQTFTAVPASRSGDEVLTFHHRVISALRPFRTALDSTNLEALDLVSTELGTSLPLDFRSVVSEADRSDPAAGYRYLEGKTVVLHSLAETATARASQILKRLVPTIDVRTNAEHVGSTQLAQLSAGADYFIVVTAAAKHAATTFIEDHRKPRPVMFVNSRGSSAILRELENQNL